MFFIVSKTLSFLVMPIVLVCLVLFISAWLKDNRWKKRFVWISFSLLLFFSNDFLANEAMRLWELPPTSYSTIKEDYAFGILLTGVTINDFEPADRVYFARGADRVVHTVDLYKRGIIKRILISGGTGRLLTEGRPEADDLFTVLKLMGVPEEDMIIENESRNTHESAVRVKEILASYPDQKLLLITSAFHMRRSRACFSKVGVEVTTFTTDFYSHPRYYTPESFIIPKADALQVWTKLFKEWTGMVAYRLAGYI
jgi:uncharacterized SAM-binding protein YcdF (DUF218 family)